MSNLTSNGSGAPQVAAQLDSPVGFHWLPKPDVLKFCQLLVNAGGYDAALATGIKPDDVKNPHAARIVEAVLSLLDNGATPMPETVAAMATERAAMATGLADGEPRQPKSAAFRADAEHWETVAQIALTDLAQLPAKFPSNGNVGDEAAKMAARFVAKRSKRAKRDEPTPDEITATAQAVASQIAATTFPDIGAKDISAPALLTGEKPEYDPFQLREMLYPSARSVSLCTEAAHAERAARCIGDDVLFCPGLGFLHYEASRGQWRTDDKDGSLTAAKLAALAPMIRAEAAALLRHAATLASVGRDADARAMSRGAGDVLTHAKQVEKRSFLSGAATFLAATCRGEVEQFAPRAWKFAFKNRVFDCGKWRAATREDYFLSVSPVAIVGGADRREWLALLDRMTGGDAELARTIQDACAYALSGASSLRALLWLYGPGGTGKSTICEMLQTVLGDGAATIDTAHLQSSGSRERLGAVLWGKRAAFISEAGNQRIDAELLKTLSGGDRLTVRFLFKEVFTAKPTHALILAANDAPKTDAYNEALKDRVIALPFVHRLDAGAPLQFAGHNRVEDARTDPNSPLLRGFAAWLADGLKRLYQSQTIYRAPSVEAATSQFWADTDPLTAFWETVGAGELRDGIAKSELRRRYESWCETEGAGRPLNRNQWARACKSRGLIEQQTGIDRVRVWVHAQKEHKERN